MNIRIKTQTFLLAFFTAIIPYLVFETLLTYHNKHLKDILAEGADHIKEPYLRQIVRSLFTLSESMNGHLLDQTEGAFKLIQHALGVPSSGLDQHVIGALGENTQHWKIFNGEGMAEYLDSVDLPELSIGAYVFRPERRMDVEVPIVDFVQSVTGASVLVFQRINEEGDMISIASSMRDEGGFRTISHVFPAVHSGHFPDSAISHVLSGRSYHSRGVMMGNWLVYTCRPIFDANNAVIGMICVGFGHNFLDPFKSEVMKINQSKKAQAWVIYLGEHHEDPRRGEHVISDLASTGSLPRQTPRDDGFVMSILEKVRQTSVNSVGEELIYVKEDGKMVTKPVFFVPFFDWNWLICVQGPAPEAPSSASFAWISDSELFAYWIHVVVLLVLVFLIVVASLTSEILTYPIHFMGNSLRNVISGSRPPLSRREMGRSISAEIARRLMSYEYKEGFRLITRVYRKKQAWSRRMRLFKYSYGNISQFIHSGYSAHANFFASIKFAQNQVDTYVRRIAQVSKGLVSLVQNFDELIPAQGEEPSEPHSPSRLKTIESVIQRANREAALIKSQMEAVLDKSTRIGNVVKMIGKIAERMDILSFNSAIEAEKARESGFGLWVIAEEIRHFGEQSQVANLDIHRTTESIARSLQIAISQMDVLTQDLRENEDNVRRIGIRHIQALGHILALRLSFKRIEREARQLTENVAKISALLKPAVSKLGDLEQYWFELEERTSQFDIYLILGEDTENSGKRRSHDRGHRNSSAPRGLTKPLALEQKQNSMNADSPEFANKPPDQADSNNQKRGDAKT